MHQVWDARNLPMPQRTTWFDAKNKIRKGALSTPTYIHMRIQLDNPSVLTVMTAAAAIAATAALFSLSASVRRPPSNKRSVTFSVMHWNVLASPFTFFNREPPKCVQGHRNPAAETETSSQQRARYSLASDQLLGASGPDAVLLQEAEQAFFETDANPRAAQLLDAYSVYTTNDAGPGTAVLLRKQSSALTPTGRVLRVGASEITGGTSKSATCVEVVVANGPPLWLISIHAAPLMFAPDAVKELLAQLAVGRTPPSQSSKAISSRSSLPLCPSDYFRLNSDRRAPIDSLCGVRTRCATLMVAGSQNCHACSSQAT